jgi:hypothetical protein
MTGKYAKEKINSAIVECNGVTTDHLLRIKIEETLYARCDQPLKYHIVR